MPYRKLETLTTGYSLAVKELGAVAPEHRTDNLAAAVPIGEHGSFQINWQRFLNHAALEGEDLVATALAALLESELIPASERVQELCSTKKAVPKIDVHQPRLKVYDSLLEYPTRQEFVDESTYETNRT